jgi:pyrrolysine biosynthesis protein PylD
MTRLTAGDLAGIPAGLAAYDAELQARTGCTLRELACRAVGLEEARLAERAAGVRVAVVPLDCGQGVLPGFAEAVRAVASHLGFEAWVTAKPDAGGLAEAYSGGAAILATADEESFIAVNLASRAVADDNEATARGFVAALERLVEFPEKGGAGGAKVGAGAWPDGKAGGGGCRAAVGPTAGGAAARVGLAGREVLVLGCGPVGRAAAQHLRVHGARVSLFDLRAERARQAAIQLGGDAVGGAVAQERAVRVEEDLEAALLRHRLLFDATPASGFIRERHITPETRIAAPGVPLGLTEGALRAIGPRLVHDPLQLGTAVMLLEALSAGRPREARRRSPARTPARSPAAQPDGVGRTPARSPTESAGRP